MAMLDVVSHILPSPDLNPKSHPIEPEMDDDFHNKYIAMATKLGVVNAATKRAMILRVCAQRGLRLYDKTTVETYLTAQYKPNSWIWKPLRTEDLGKLQQSHSRHNGQIERFRIYQGAIPLPVLLTVEAILETIPEGVHFYVSDISRAETSKDDPFLMVSAVGMDDLIIERWDEPNFKG